VRRPEWRPASFGVRFLAGLLLGASLFHLIGWVGVGASEGRSLSRHAMLHGPASHASSFARGYAFEALGTHYLDEADLGSAATAFTEAVLADSLNTRVPAYLGMTLLGQGRTDEALVVLEEAAQRMPEVRDVQFRLGQAYLAKGWSAEASRAFAAAVAADSLYADAYVSLAIARREQGDLLGANQALDRMAARFPDDPRIAANRGRVWEELGDWDRAIVAYREAVELDPADDTSRFNLARLLMRQGEMDPAIEVLESLVERSPGDYEAWVTLGNARSSRGDAEGAVRAFRRAAEAAPDRPEAHFNLARFHLAAGDTAGARTALNAVAARDSTGRTGQLARQLLELLDRESSSNRPGGP
jgi:tetratricopeptide (TPR) repeat protein